jgi:hypothetical protein
MLKKIGVSALLLASLGVVSAPALHAEDGYYGGGYYGHRDRDDRHERREWRERERWREHEWRERERWREHEWRERERWNRQYYYPGYSYYPGYQPGTSFYFQYGR